MKIYTLIAVALLFAAVSADGTLNINTDACSVYTGKFGTTNSADGVGTTKLAFSGEASFIAGSADAVVKFRYSDDDFYNNSTFSGLVTEDGQAAANTCLSLKLFKYTTGSFADPVQVTDLPITSDKNDAKRWRYYIINFKGEDLDTRLIRTDSPDYYVYTGYYGLAYYLQGTTQVQYTHLFSFAFRVNRKSSAVVDTAFFPLSDTQRLKCSNGEPSCTVTAVSQLQFCVEATCTTFTTTPNIHLNDDFWVLHKVTTDGLKTYKFSESQVFFVASGLLKKASIVAAYSTGSAIYKIKATIAWDSLSIQATTQLTQARRLMTEGNFRLLVEGPADNVQATSSVIPCIKNANDVCATCDEMCTQNCGYAQTSCTCTDAQKALVCSYSSLLGFSLLLAVLVV